MHELTFLQDMAIVMAISAAVMIICHRVHIPVVLGYILAGIIIGPHTPPFPLVKDFASIQTLSELGVIFLLFGIGLEFSLTRLLRVGLVSFVAATLEIVLMVWIGFSLGQAFGWNFMNSLFLGATLSISSTTIIAKILLEMKRLHEPFAQVILGILIIEDLLAIVIIALLSGLATTGELTLEAGGLATLKVGAFVAGTLFLGLWLVPRLLRYLQRFESAELLVVTVLGLCFGVSLIAAKFGFSVALGAFLIGAIIAETRQVHEIIQRIEPIRDMFTAVFFVSVGMLLDPRLLAQFAGPIVVITVVMIVGKVISCALATFLTGYAPDTALRVGLGLAQIGEFSFIIARLGEATRVTSPFLYPIVVSVSGITTLTTPLLMRHTDQLVKALTRWSPKLFVTLGSLYLAWLERIKAQGIGSKRQQAIWNGLRTQMPRLAFYGSGIILVSLVANHLAAWVSVPRPLFWGLVGIVMFPLLLGVAYTIDRILWEVLASNFLQEQEESYQTQEARETLHNLLRFLTVFVCSLALFVLSPFFAPLLSLSVAVTGVVAVSGLVLWGSVRRFHEQLERVVFRLFDRQEPAEEIQLKRSRDELVQLIREEYPWEVETQDLLLPYIESAINQTIKALQVRSKTGATIVGIYRGSEAIVNPPPEMLLLPGDVLLLMGSQEQIERAMQYLHGLMKQPRNTPLKDASQAKTQRFEIVAGSPWVGKTLGALDLRQKTGVHVVGIQRGTVSMTNPDAEIRIEERSVLVLFGLPDQLDRAVQYLSQEE